MKLKFLAASLAVGTLMLASCNGTETETKTDSVKVKMSGEEVAKAAQAIEMPALINPNKAQSEHLQAMMAAGVSSDVVQLLVEARPFDNAQAMDTFLTANLTPEMKKTFYNVAFLPMDLNSTPEADFKIIPGVDDKMAHEFEEYRPYTDMNQFDREIGKYVDAQELARLRRYVTIQ